MSSAEDLIRELRAEITALEDRFLKNWLPAQPSHSPADFQHDVKAYCVLAHAAFEEFVEEISLLALKAAENAWLAKTFSQGTISLLLFYGDPIKISDNEDESQARLFDQLKDNIKICIDKHSKALANNHGFSQKYLRNILTPVGIDVPETVKLIESLRELANARGSYAHTKAKYAMYGSWKRADRPMVPEQAKETVADCLELCEQLTNKV